MALRSVRERTDIPKNAVELSKDEALIYQIEVIGQQPLSEV